MEKVDLVVISKALITMDANESFFEPGYIAISKNKIVGVGNASGELPFKGKQLLHLPGHVVIPGLINSHTHAPMTLFRGLADDLPLKEWLEKHIWPMEAKFINPDSVYEGSLIACAELALNGVTTFVDMYFSEEGVARASKKVGIRSFIGEGILDFPTPISPTVEDSLKRAEEMVRTFLGEELIRPTVAPHAPYTCSKDTLLKAASIAERYSVPLHIHLAEEKWEQDNFKKEHRVSSVRYLNDIGFFDYSRVICAHVNWIDDKDAEILAQKRVGVIHNPRSNMKLATGICPVPDLLSRGINIGLGTDGASSNNCLSVLDEAQEAARLHKITKRDPTCITAIEALRMATSMAAKALGVDDEIGSISLGKKADFIALNFEKIHLKPLYDYYSHLIYAARPSDVEYVYVNGAPVVFAGNLLNISQDEIFEISEKYETLIKEAQ